MRSAAETIVLILELYLTVGMASAALFVTLRVHRVMPHRGPVTAGARALILPGATLLWPWVVTRWMRAR